MTDFPVTTLKEMRKCGPAVVRKCFQLDEGKTDEELKRTLQVAYCKKDKGDVKQLDFYMKRATDGYNDAINK